METIIIAPTSSDVSPCPHLLGKLIEWKRAIAQIKQRSQREAHTVG